MIKKIVVLGSIAFAVSGCQLSTNALNPKYGTYNHLLNKSEDSYCDAIGCGKDLAFYPMSRGEAQRRADACNWDWGKTSSAHSPSSAEYKRLRAEEEAQGQIPGLCE